MNRHLDEGQLRAHLDGALEPAAAQACVLHLAACPACQARLAAVDARAHRVARRLSDVSFTAEAPPGPAPRRALQQFKDLVFRKETPVLSKLFHRRFRSAWSLAAAALIAVLALSVPSVRAFASGFLGLFRIQQVAVLPVDTTRLTAITGNSTLMQQIGQLFSESVTVTREPAPARVAASAAEAAGLAGFALRLPASRSDAPQFMVEAGGAFEFVVDRDRAQALLDEAGRRDLVLPATLDGARIAVDIPAGVSAAYGDCPRPQPGRVDPDEPGSRGRLYLDCVVLAQVPSPTVSTPPDVDLGRLAEIALQVTGMSAEEARAFSATVDWTSTLVIPIPRNAAAYEQVAVDGVTGALIRRPADESPEYALVWARDGIVYAIAGLGNDIQPALAMANSMK